MYLVRPAVGSLGPNQNTQLSLRQQLKNQIFLDDDNFVHDMQNKLNPEQSL